METFLARKVIEEYLRIKGYENEINHFKFELNRDPETNLYELSIKQTNNTSSQTIIPFIKYILKLLAIEFKNDSNSFLLTKDNLTKLPTQKELLNILKNIKKIITTDTDLSHYKYENLNEIQLGINKTNPVIKKPSLLALSPQASSLISDPRENKINSIDCFENIWHATKRGNSFRFAEKYYEIKFRNYLNETRDLENYKIILKTSIESIYDIGDSKKNSIQSKDDNYIKLLNEKSNDFFIAFFSKAYIEMTKINQDFSWQDAINTLEIAKAFGGLSNLKHQNNEGYRKIQNHEFIDEIKQKFPDDYRFNSLNEAKLKQYKIFSKIYQEATQDILKSNRSPRSQTGLRLTFFPDRAIDRLLSINSTEFDFNKSAKIIDDFKSRAQFKTKLKITSI